MFSLTDVTLQIVFDECHKAKNASSTKMGKAVLDLQNKLPQARVVYASATGELLSMAWAPGVNWCQSPVCSEGCPWDVSTYTESTRLCKGVQGGERYCSAGGELGC